MSVMVAVFVGMFVAVVRVVMMMLMCEVDIKFHGDDGRFLLARNVEMPAVELELLQFALQFFGVYAEVNQGGDEHIAGDAAEDVEVKGFHFEEPSALIWLAA